MRKNKFAIWGFVFRVESTPAGNFELVGRAGSKTYPLEKIGHFAGEEAAEAALEKWGRKNNARNLSAEEEDRRQVATQPLLFDSVLDPQHD